MGIGVWFGVEYLGEDSVEECLFSLFVCRFEGQVNGDLLRRVIQNRLSEVPVQNRKNFKTCVKVIKRELRQSGIDVTAFYKKPGKERRQRLRELQEAAISCFPGEIGGVRTSELVENARELGVTKYDKNSFISLVEYLEKRCDSFEPEVVCAAINNALYLESVVSGRTEIKFPSVRRGYREFVNGLVSGKIQFIGVGCPEYLENYRLGDGISAETQLYLNNVPLFTALVSSSGVEIEGKLLIANTEDDMPEVLQRLTGGDGKEFTDRCARSVSRIRDNLNSDGLRNPRIEVGLLLDFMPGFRQRQYHQESLIRLAMVHDQRLRKRVQTISEQRAEKYQEILGREERSNELTIRYVAQYQVLGKCLKELTRTTGTTFIIFNYSTPNLEEFNSGFRGHRVPVFEIQR